MGGKGFQETSGLPKTMLRSPTGVSQPGSLQVGISVLEAYQRGALVSSGWNGGPVGSLQEHLFTHGVRPMTMRPLLSSTV